MVADARLPTGPPASAADSQPPIRIVIVDDHVIVRRGIRALLATEDNIEVVGEAEEGGQALRQAEAHQPDVMLMDLVMPNMDGIEATRLITARWPETRVLVLTSFAADDKVFPAIKAGALGYLLKDSTPEELVSAIRRAYRGEPSLHPTIAQKVLHELSPLSDEGWSTDPLTDQETEVLQLVARGQTNRDIGGTLGLPERAVRARVTSILNKLHMVSRTEAVLYALRQGLASLEDLTPDRVTRLLAMVGKSSPGAGPSPAAGPPEAVEPLGRPASRRELEALRLIAADHETVGQELALAGEIQAGFLPEVLPVVPGWQLAATLEPARETAGDFFDVMSLPNGRLGLLIADVADKGMGAALYMALSRTLIRTYAPEFDARPDLVLSAVNGRILRDARASLFVTVFYGILDPGTGALVYSNAGHNPPFVLSARSGEPPRELVRTGMPLGVFEEESWEQATISLGPGDALVLYTDGITDALDQYDTHFGRERLLGRARAALSSSAQGMLDDVIGHVHRFVGDAPRFDDVTLMIVVRDA